MFPSLTSNQLEEPQKAEPQNPEGPLVPSEEVPNDALFAPPKAILMRVIPWTLWERIDKVQSPCLPELED